jgi:glutamate dehydrogenase (NAD(P)+)
VDRSCVAYPSIGGFAVQHTIEYVDPEEGFRGYLVYEGDGCRIAAGGCRVQPGLSLATLQALAARMAAKQRLLGLAVDGAKCGIDYHPGAPGKAAALGRFLAFLRQELGTRLSMGCDMGTGWHELEILAAAQGIPSVKYCIRAAQELTDEQFFQRLHLLDERVGGLTVGERRAGHALAHAALAAAAHQGRNATGLRCAVQGFGNLGRAAAGSLAEAGAVVTAVSDEFGCVADPAGLDVPAMLATPASRQVRGMHVGRAGLPRERLFDLPADVLVLAAGADAVGLDAATVLPIPVVAVGANHGLSELAEHRLAARGVLVVPDFVAGAGGPASMNALFGPAAVPTPAQVLDLVAGTMRELVGDVLAGARDRGLAPRQVAAAIAAAAAVNPQDRPYGASPYLPAAAPTGRRAAAARRARALPDEAAA